MRSNANKIKVQNDIESTGTNVRKTKGGLMALQVGIFADLLEEERNRPRETRSSLENPETPLS
jgi:hypothetical protein